MIWVGIPPEICDLCDCKLQDTFVDGNTNNGWAIMCEECAKDFGIGFGTGKGQLYQKQLVFVKVKG